RPPSPPLFPYTTLFRSDIPNPNAPNILGDAWLGVYSSLDGGDTWKSTLLPGYPQDTSTVGKASPLHAYTVATDPTVRAGTNELRSEEHTSELQSPDHLV